MPKKKQERPKNAPYIRKDGQPHGSTYGEKVVRQPKPKEPKERVKPEPAIPPENPALNWSKEAQIAKNAEEIGLNTIGTALERPVIKRAEYLAGIIPGGNPTADVRAMLTREPNWDPNDPSSDWHNGARKFTRDKQVEFLESLSRTGRIGLSAYNVGVTQDTVRRHAKSDPAFGALQAEALSVYKESAVAILTNQALEGIVDVRWDKEGNVLAVRRVFETQLRLRLLEWSDPDFQQKSKEEITVQQGGAIMIPTPTDDLSKWNDVVDAVNKAAIDTQGVEATVPGLMAPAPDVE